MAEPSLVGMVVSSKSAVIRDIPIDQKTFSFPEEKERLACFEIKMLMLDGSWQASRLIWTKEYLAFASTEQSLLIDAVPLDEVCHIEDVNHRRQRKPSEVSDEKEQIDSLTLANFGRRMSVILQRKASLFINAEENSSAKNLNVFSHMGKGQLQMSLSSFQIGTVEEGYNSGRKYYLQANSDQDRDVIMDEIQKRANAARIEKEAKSRFRRSQESVRRVLTSSPAQIFVAFLIALNFAANVAQMQLNQSLREDDGSFTDTGKLLDSFDIFFTIIFTVELCVTLYAYWLQTFLQDGWNIFDLIVVTLSLVALGPWTMPIIVIRSLRAFRIARIFRRVRSLRNITAALTASIVPVLNSFLVMLIVSSIYAILAVTFFSDQAPEVFGVFDQALVALFRISCGDPWSDYLPPFQEDGTINPGNVLFMVSYIIIVMWTLLQVSVAILIDKFITASATMQRDEQDKQMSEKREKNQIKTALDPLLEQLSQAYIDDGDLTSRIRNLFQALDTDESNSLSFKRLSAEMKKLNFEPRMHITEADFNYMTANGTFCNAKGHMSGKDFEDAIREQLRLYMQRHLSDQLQHSGCTDLESTQMRALKMVLLEQQRLQVECNSSASSNSLAGAEHQGGDLRDRHLSQHETAEAHEFMDSFRMQLRGVLHDVFNAKSNVDDLAPCDQLLDLRPS